MRSHIENKMKNFTEFTNLYPLSKTLRFELIPQGRTKENIERLGLLSEDEHRAESYKKTKKLIDEYHREYIRNNLSTVSLSNLEMYMELYLNNDKSDKEKKEQALLESDLRKDIKRILESGKEYKDLFNKNLFKKVLPEFNKVKESEENQELLKEFDNYTTYFMGFHENRKNMYSDEEKSTAIPYRLINQNLPKFIDNMLIFSHFEKSCDKTVLDEAEAFLSDGKKSVRHYFCIDGFNDVLTQEGIDRYNRILGGYSMEDGRKIKGLNEYINEFDQKASKEKRTRIGKLKPLFKIMLSDRTAFSFIPEQFENDRQVLESISDFSDMMLDTSEKLMKIAAGLAASDINRIYVDAKSVNAVSHEVFGDWAYINTCRAAAYDAEHTGRRTKNYDEKKSRELKRADSFSIGYIDDICDVKDTDASVENMIGCRAGQMLDEINDNYGSLKAAVDSYDYSRGDLSNNSDMLTVIKSYLDSVKQFYDLLKPLNGNGKEPDKDEVFYGEFIPMFESAEVLIPLYNKVRNYMTKKPYSMEKIKLNFHNQELLNGWDINKEGNNKSVILLRNGKYYLAIVRKETKYPFNTAEEYDGEDCFEKMEYKLLPGANKMLPKVFFSKKRIDEFGPSEEILRIRKNESFKKGPTFDIDDCHKYIDFFKESISKHEDWSKFDFRFSPTESYEDISGFYREVEAQGYMMNFRRIKSSTIEKMVEDGDLFLFQIYNKDFSSYSKGTPNLHTLYWKMLFDPQNLDDVVYKLNGEAEVFYRKASIKPDDMIVHPAGCDIKNKNPLNENKTSRFEYNIIKDRRFTVDKFQFHVPITLNFKAQGRNNINDLTRKYIRSSDDLHIIGIDRGERHLLYVSVIDMDGNIVEQRTMNTISNKKATVDYHEILDKKEKERLNARREWKTIESIKEMKEGYLSQAVHEITKMILKYNAIVVMEDLNTGFKRGREKVEKQVYQKFEKMLIDKLNYLVDKKADKNEFGGLLHAYQLTGKFESFSKMGKETGIIFYIPAWNTSNIDPSTGFINAFGRLLNYQNVEMSLDFWSRFDAICYDDKKDLFRFTFNYTDFTSRTGSSKDHWDVYSYGTRVINKRNKKNNIWESNEIDITGELRALCDEYAIDLNDKDLKAQILGIDEKEFHKRFIYLFKLVMQMRNSITGTETDYMISPVMNSHEEFYDSRRGADGMPENADANGAYNIAKKGLWSVRKIKAADEAELRNLKFNMDNETWLRFAQDNCI